MMRAQCSLHEYPVITQSDISEPVAIIALAGRFPGAPDVESFWDNLCAGRESITFFGPGELDDAVGLNSAMIQLRGGSRHH